MDEPNIKQPPPDEDIVWPGGKSCTRATWDAGAKRYMRGNYRVVTVGSLEYFEQLRVIHERKRSIGLPC